MTNEATAASGKAHWSAGAGMLCCVAASKSPFGRLSLVIGPEGLLADRAVDALCQQMRSVSPEVEITEIEAPGSIAANSLRSPVRHCFRVVVLQ